ncbi:helix-turn-helix transcriptional regulator [Roseobacteraceae bacterium S113]
MQRKQRLNAVMSALEADAWTRAEDLARTLGVTPRTIYRDMDALRAGGVSIDGSRGQGYRARHALTLPPVSLSERELEALYLGLAAVEQMSDPELSDAAVTLADRLDDILPQERTRPADLAAGAVLAPDGLTHLLPFRSALRAGQLLDLDLKADAHVLRPLALRHWGRVWLWLGWSETTSRFLTGSLGQIEGLRGRPELFVPEPGKRLEDYDDRHAFGG